MKTAQLVSYVYTFLNCSEVYWEQCYKQQPMITAFK